MCVGENTMILRVLRMTFTEIQICLFQELYSHDEEDGYYVFFVASSSREEEYVILY